LSSSTEQLTVVQEKQQPVFVSVTSNLSSWRAAVGEIVQELQSIARDTPDRKWDFGIVFIQGYNEDENVVLEVTKILDSRLDTDGCLLGIDTESAVGSLLPRGSDTQDLDGDLSCITVSAMRLPRDEDGGLGADVLGARPFAIGKEELAQISMRTLKLQDSLGSDYYDQSGVNNPTPLAWRQHLGVDHHEPQGILLFADPGSSDYTVKQVLSSLDLTFPTATKVGGVCSPMRECRMVVAPAAGEQPAGAEGKVAGLVLPSNVALHALVSRAGFDIGPKLQVTKAEGHMVTEINNESPQKAIAAACKSLGPLDEVLMNRNGLLMGIETKKEEVTMNSMDTTAPSIQRDSTKSQYLVRSFQFMPDGDLYVRSHDFKRVPPNVGEPRKNVQLHVRDEYRAHEDCKLMLRRYSVARLCFQECEAPVCTGAVVFHCAASDTSVDGFSAELRSLFGRKDMPVSRANLRGEIGPPMGIAMGGIDSRHTDRHGHTVTGCLFCYNPPSEACSGVDVVDELQWNES
jgi:small ligand-binding sensory domain FIST